MNLNYIEKTKGEGGFTLIELIMVIVVLSILGIAVVPRFTTSNISVSAAAELIASDIVFTQQDAMSSHLSKYFYMTAGSIDYCFAEDAVTPATPPSCTYRTRTLTDINSALSISSINAAGPLYFNSLGEPVGITAQVSIVVTDGTNTANITIEPYTGKVTP